MKKPNKATTRIIPQRGKGIPRQRESGGTPVKTSASLSVSIVRLCVDTPIFKNLHSKHMMWA